MKPADWLDSLPAETIESLVNALYRRQSGRHLPPDFPRVQVSRNAPAVTAEQILTALAELLAPRIAELLAADGAVAKKPPKRRRPAIRCEIKPPERVPTDLEAAKARQVLRAMGVKSR